MHPSGLPVLLYIGDGTAPAALARLGHLLRADDAGGALDVVPVDAVVCHAAPAGLGATLDALDGHRTLDRSLPLIVLQSDPSQRSAVALRWPGLLVCAADGDDPALPELLRLAVAHRRALRALAATDGRLQRLIDDSSDAVLVCRGSALVQANAAAAALLAAPAAALVGRPLRGLMPEAAAVVVETLMDAAREADCGAPPPAPTRVQWLDGAGRPVERDFSASRVAGGAVQLLVRAVPRRMARRPARESGYDRLTGLPSRSQFRDRLGGTLARARRDGRSAALLFVGIDHFRRINAELGQAGGDAVLGALAERLRKTTRQGDTVARLDGDQFALSLEAIDDATGAARAAARVLDAIAAPLEQAGRTWVVRASVGLALYPADAAEPDTLWRNADLALRHAKERGRAQYQHYRTELDTESERERTRRADLAARAARLTPREKEVMALLVTGKANKMVAYLLGTASRTVEKHRASIMDKMRADSLADLVRMAVQLAS